MADFYTMEEAARVLGISLDELKQRIANGELRHAGEGGSPSSARRKLTNTPAARASALTPIYSQT